MQLAHPSRYQRRCVPASWELAYVCDGDQNGVLRYIGTSYGTQVGLGLIIVRIAHGIQKDTI